MKVLLISLLLVASHSALAAPPVPLASGHYVFHHRFAEHPSIPSITVNVTISGTDIVIVNPKEAGPFPAGVLDSGRLMWHAASGQWIIGHNDADKFTRDVGGCSDGPPVVDLAAKIYWTC